MSIQHHIDSNLKLESFYRHIFEIDPRDAVMRTVVHASGCFAALYAANA